MSTNGLKDRIRELEEENAKLWEINAQAAQHSLDMVDQHRHQVTELRNAHLLDRDKLHSNYRTKISNRDDHIKQLKDTVERLVERNKRATEEIMFLRSIANSKDTTSTENEDSSHAPLASSASVADLQHAAQSSQGASALSLILGD